MEAFNCLDLIRTFNRPFIEEGGGFSYHYWRMQAPAALGLEFYFYNALSYAIEALFEVGKLYTVIYGFTAWLAIGMQPICYSLFYSDILVC